MSKLVQAGGSAKSPCSAPAGTSRSSSTRRSRPGLPCRWGSGEQRHLALAAAAQDQRRLLACAQHRLRIRLERHEMVPEHLRLLLERHSRQQRTFGVCRLEKPTVQNLLADLFDHGIQQRLRQGEEESSSDQRMKLVLLRDGDARGIRGAPAVALSIPAGSHSALSRVVPCLPVTGLLHDSDHVTQHDALLNNVPLPRRTNNIVRLSTSSLNGPGVSSVHRYRAGIDYHDDKIHG